MNNWSITGNLGQDCRTNDVNGTAVANFSVAVKAGFGEKAQTLWVDCALWGKRAEGGLIQYLVKGQQVGVTGELSTETGKDGKTYLKVRCSEVDLLGGKASDVPSQPAPATSQPAPTGQMPEPIDDFDDDKENVA